MEILLEIFLEFLLQIVPELLIELALHRFSRYGWAQHAFNTGVALVLYFGIGLIVGFISLAVFPRAFVRSQRFPGISMIISPVLAGLTMMGIGRIRRWQGVAVLRIDLFAYAFVFALGISLIRFVMAT